MTNSNRLSANELDILVQERTVELEKVNQELSAEILECKKANEALSCDRNLLESVTQTTDFMLASFDPQFNFVWVNSAYSESCQMKPEDMIGKNHFALYPHAENEAIFRHVRDTGEGVFYKDKPFVYPDQPERGVTYWDWSLMPVKDSGGNITGLVLSLRETTKHKQAEEALCQAHEDLQIQSEELQAANEELQVQSEELQAQTEELEEAYEALSESEKRYRMLFTNMTEAFLLGEIICDRDGKPYDYRYLEMNPAFELQTGIKRERVKGKSALEVFHSIPPIEIEEFGKVALSCQSTYFEVFAPPTNRYFNIYSFSPEKGKFAVIFTDITKRKEVENKLKETLDNLENLVKERTAELEKSYNSLKESEDRLKALFKLLPVGVSITDKERNTLDANLALERILDLSRSDLLERKQTTRKYLKADGTEMPFEEFPSVRALKEKGSIQSSEIGIVNEDGSTIWTDVSAVYLPSSDGQVVIATRDITEHRKEEHRIHRYNSVLMAINRIFGGVVRAETERELGSACLSIALGITDSKIGFIVEVGKDGTLHNIAISKRGFGQDLMDDRTGHPRLPGDSILHGPYDCIIDTGKSFFINDLWSYPDSTDLPQGHPTLKSFLGVPLIQEGKTTGMIVVANREGGYSSEQQEDLEAIAPAVTQALWRKKAEETLAKISTARQKEIHHRIKNNLQVISSLLDLQAEKFNNRKCIQDSEVLEAFRESQDRVMSIALIHKELHEGGRDNALNFSLYLQRLTESLLQTYRIGNAYISLDLNLEENIFFDMDTAVPLGMIVNELVSNSLKYAFSDRDRGKIQIKLSSEETGNVSNDKGKLAGKGTRYTLLISDNGVGIPEEIGFENPKTLGLQLVNILVDQLDGEIEIKRNKGTEFTIRFSNIEK